MQILPLAQLPNQAFNVTLDSVRYDFNFYTLNNSLCYDLSVATVPVLSGKRVVSGCFLIPYFCYAASGNFFLLTQNNNLPNYAQFGISQFLIYLALSEIQAAIAAAPPPAYLVGTWA